MTDTSTPRRRLLRRAAAALGAFAALLFLVYWLYFAWPVQGGLFGRGDAGPPPLTPAWALECWVWEDDVNTAAFTRELLDDYKRHDFPVRTILIDSPWSTRYNDFTFDEARYPDPERFFGELEADGYRVVLWMTPMVNSYSEDAAIRDSSQWYAAARGAGRLAGGGFQVDWWKGRGGFIDYADPEAMAWWRGMQQTAFDYGIDGWKLDGAATYFHSRLGPVPFPYQWTDAGLATMRQYMDQYYRGEYRHGRTQNPEFVCLSRSVDQQFPVAHNRGFAPLDASAVNWVGDQTHAWALEDEGIEEALRDILASARRGYCVVGSDVAGFSGDEPISKELYVRWAQFSAYCGLFLNGGHGERRPSKWDAEQRDLVRRAMWRHDELVPYIYNHVAAYRQGGQNLMRPVEGGDEYDWFFGDAFYIAALHEPGGRRTVRLPEGRWRWMGDAAKVIEGPTTLTRTFALDEFPAYIRDGAIIPMRVRSPYTRIGDASWQGFTVFDIYPHGESVLAYRAPEDEGASTLALRVDADAKAVRIRFHGKQIPHILRVFLSNEPASVSCDGVPLEAGEAWQYEPLSQRLTVRTDEYANGTYVIRR